MKVLLSTIISLVMFLALNAQNLTYIDLEQTIFEEINAEKICKEFEFVPLETHKNALLNIKTATYYVTDKYIIAVQFLRGAYLFDRKTGAFIREVSSFGQGPDEYTGWIYHKSGFDEDNNILFANDGTYIGGSWKGINIETNKVELTIKKPISENDNESLWVSAPRFMKDNIYVTFCNNRTGKNKIRLVLFDKKGNIIKKYPNYLEYKDYGAMSRPADNGIFYYYNGLTYFKEWNYNDTVFCITENNMLPHIIFKTGNKQASYYHQDNADNNIDKYLINFVYESDSFVLFNFLYYTETTGVMGSNTIKSASLHTGYYDKRSKKSYISSTPDYKITGYTINGIPVRFYPIYINKNKEMIAKINPEELIKHKDKIDSKYKHLFQNIQEDDNPIVVIATLKK